MNSPRLFSWLPLMSFFSSEQLNWEMFMLRNLLTMGDGWLLAVFLEGVSRTFNWKFTFFLCCVG